MSVQINRQQAELILERRFKGKYIQFTYPGYNSVYGRCDRISIGTGIRDAGMVLIVISDTLYRCSPEELNNCLTLLKSPENGNTHTGGAEPPAGSS